MNLIQIIGFSGSWAKQSTKTDGQHEMPHKSFFEKASASFAPAFTFYPFAQYIQYHS